MKSLPGKSVYVRLFVFISSATNGSNALAFPETDVPVTGDPAITESVLISITESVLISITETYERFMLGVRYISICTELLN